MTHWTDAHPALFATASIAGGLGGALGIYVLIAAHPAVFWPLLAVAGVTVLGTWVWAGSLLTRQRLAAIARVDREHQLAVAADREHRALMRAA